MIYNYISFYFLIILGYYFYHVFNINKYLICININKINCILNIYYNIKLQIRMKISLF